MSARIHPTALIEKDVAIGDGTNVWDNVHIRFGASLGEQCIVGEKSYIAYGVRIGHRVKINAFVYICNAVTIEDGVMISAGTIFTNDRFPRATMPDLKTLRSSDPDEHTLATLVKEGATIGAGCVIGNDLSIGRWAMVGMGSVVTKSVPDFHLVMGSPARSVGAVCKCGPMLMKFDREFSGEFSGNFQERFSANPAARRIALRGRLWKKWHERLAHAQLHRRDADATNMLTNSKSFAILGGGVLGMTLAHRLADAGHRVTIFEAAAELGGLASAWNLNGISWDRHYHVTLLSDSDLRDLLGTLKLDEEMRWVETRTGFFMGGKLYSMSNSLEFLKFPPLSLIDKFRLGATIAYAARVKDWKRLEKIPVADWLTKLSGKNVFEKMWKPLLRAKLGENYQQASAAFIWAIIARMYAARRSGLKKEMFGYLPGGYSRFFNRFGQLLQSEGVEVRLNSPAASVQANVDGSVQVELRSGERQTFDQVVMTLPSAVAADLCPSLTDEERAKLNGVTYQGIICASVLLKQPLANFYVTNLIDSWVPFTAVIEMTALVDRDQFGGDSLVYLPKYVDPDDAMFDQTDEEIRSTFVAALERMYPAFKATDVVAFQVSRVRRVLAISTLNYSEKLPPMATSIPGVHIVNSAHISNGTLNVNETIQLANTAATQLLAAVSTSAGQAYLEAKVA